MLEEKKHRYFKGHDKDGQRTVYEVFEEPQKGFSAMFHDNEKDTYLVTRYHLDKQAKEHYKTVEDAEQAGEVLSREITKEEFEVYSCIQAILDEIYMNQFTGGFPRMENVSASERRLAMIVRHMKLADKSFNDCFCDMLKAQGMY